MNEQEEAKSHTVVIALEYLVSMLADVIRIHDEFSSFSQKAYQTTAEMHVQRAQCGVASDEVISKTACSPHLPASLYLFSSLQLSYTQWNPTVILSEKLYQTETAADCARERASSQRKGADTPNTMTQQAAASTA